MIGSGESSRSRFDGPQIGVVTRSRHSTGPAGHDAAVHRGTIWAGLINNVVLKKPRTTLTCSRSWEIGRPGCSEEEKEAHLAANVFASEPARRRRVWQCQR